MPPLQSGRGQTRSKTIYHVPINPPPALFVGGRQQSGRIAPRTGKR